MINKSPEFTVSKTLKITGHIILVIVFVAGLLLSYGTKSHDQTMVNGIDDLSTIQITIDKVQPFATGVILKAKEYSTAFVVSYVFVPKSYTVPSKEDISAFLQVGTKVNLTVKQEVIADLNAYSNLHVYKLTSENGKIIFDGSQGALDYSKHFLKRFERLFQCMVVVPFIYFVSFFILRIFVSKKTSICKTYLNTITLVFIAAVFLCSSSHAADTEILPEKKFRQIGSTFRDCPNCPEIVVVPAGDFLMGTSKTDMGRDLSEVPQDERTTPIPFLIKGPEELMAREMPQHLVHISHPFGLGKYPVTRAEFAAFVQETGYQTKIDCSLSTGRGFLRARGTWQQPGFPQTDNSPVVCLNLYDAAAYIAWLNTKVQNPASTKAAVYHLPSEAEWEYAARAGTQTAYWWGNSIGSNHTVCHGCGSRWDFKQPAPVGSFPSNQFGLYDMLGNVWEPTVDCWNKDYSGAPSDGSAWMTGNCEKHASRGGDWGNDPWTLRAAARAISILDLRSNSSGFRVARNLQ